MLFSTVKMVTAMLLLWVTTVSAWKFKGWSDDNYQGAVIIALSGDSTTDGLCVGFHKINNNKMSSFKWNPQKHDCEFKLFNFAGCAGRHMLASRKAWDVSSIAAKQNNKATSLWISCK